MHGAFSPPVRRRHALFAARAGILSLRTIQSAPTTKIDEYVPATTPTKSVSVKSLIVLPPKKYSATTANKVVKLVLICLARVW